MDLSYRKFDLYDFIPIGVCIIDKNHTIIFWNKQLEVWTNLKGENLVGKNFFEAFPNLDNPKYRLPIQSVLNGAPPVVFSTQLHKTLFPSFLPNGEPRLLHTTVSAFFCEELHQQFAIFSVEDYTFLSYRVREHKKARDQALQEIERRKIVEAELRDSEAKLKELNATKDKFFSIIAHDLRSPIGAFKNVLELLSMSWDEMQKEEILGFIEALKESAYNLFALLENLLLWSRAQTGRIEVNSEEFQLEDLIRMNVELLSLNAKDKNIRLSFCCPDDITVYADRQMVTTVLRNLISNAIKFTNEGGEIKVLAEKKDDFAIVCVQDNGVGMNEETLSKLFRLDVHHTSLGTKQERGTGLGLILVKEFVERNNGKIWVESEENKGSKFYFTLPLKKEKK